MTTTAPRTALEILPLAGHIGAEIHGVDLSEPLDPETLAEIRSTLVKWKVVFFRDQQLTQDQHIAFGRQFGDVTPAHPTLPPAFPDHPEILLLDNQAFGKREAEDAGAKAKSMAPSIESRWHTDVTFVPNPPMGSILRGLVVPTYGGDTQWTNLVVAYQQLSPPLQRLCDELHAVHHNFLPLSRGELSGALKKQFQSQDLRAVHPVVRVHPESGEKALFVNPNFTSHIVELSRAEGNHLLALLYEHLSNPTYTCRFRWEPGSIAFWDNRATCHLVPTDVPPGTHRSMQRITIAGDLPVGPDGSVSYSLSGDSFS
ncbi:MAG TPA: TauD/TfdA family dioxygenase [Frankiaceae bacterium]|jgi:taurine dioxygenase|nr:TauD/TfdA family dioxygenase [Frankiaceae bacterium]